MLGRKIDFHFGIKFKRVHFALFNSFSNRSIVAARVDIKLAEPSEPGWIFQMQRRSSVVINDRGAGSSGSPYHRSERPCVNGAYLRPHTKKSAGSFSLGKYDRQLAAMTMDIVFAARGVFFVQSHDRAWNN
jgi:hypothetical protein